MEEKLRIETESSSAKTKKRVFSPDHLNKNKNNTTSNKSIVL